MSTTRLPADERRDQLLDVALEVFATAGFHGASMNDVAEAAGVTKPVLYQHFDSKNDLFAALLDEVGRRMRTAIDKATADAVDGKDATIRGFRAYFRWVAADLDGFRLLFGGAARHDAAFAEQVRAITSDAATAIAPLIAADVDDDTRRLIAHGLVGLAEGSSRRLLAHGQPFDPDAVAETVAGLAWAGLRSLDAAN
ncbi:MAG: TetR/AcrR family transcriptional regulator [Ilumatobacteraceae bacterium]|nr:TetR/AcrR family transcriptional regulator [Actinomycetota bacterium]